MNVPQTNKEKGFTIIEVVLVLAIAGLIFLMVFIALPALQRSQRDTQRRDDLSRFQSQLTNYETNNRGAIPRNADTLDSFVAGYLKPDDGEFNDPATGDPYDVRFGRVQPSDEGIIYYQNGSKCEGETIVDSTNSRQAAMIMKLEGSGYFCTTNQ